VVIIIIINVLGFLHWQASQQLAAARGIA